MAKRFDKRTRVVHQRMTDISISLVVVVVDVIIVETACNYRCCLADICRPADRSRCDMASSGAVAQGLASAAAAAAQARPTAHHPRRCQRVQGLQRELSLFLLPSAHTSVDSPGPICELTTFAVVEAAADRSAFTEYTRDVVGGGRSPNSYVRETGLVIGLNNDAVGITSRRLSRARIAAAVTRASIYRPRDAPSCVNWMLIEL